MRDFEYRIPSEKTFQSLISGCPDRRNGILKGFGILQSTRENFFGPSQKCRFFLPVRRIISATRSIR